MVPKKVIRSGVQTKEEVPKQVVRKLVRDKIPEIIAARGEIELFDVIEPKDRLLVLRAKLIEEMDEFLAAESYSEQVEEAADLSEVVRAIVRASFISPFDVERKRIAKKKARGGFTQFTALVRVI
jgi:predicted house-cleaning noncanonical NTP pyrophosphatase (MazG superfamily)